jgi:hypothetical protein
MLRKACDTWVRCSEFNVTPVEPVVVAVPPVLAVPLGCCRVPLVPVLLPAVAPPCCVVEPPCIELEPLVPAAPPDPLPPLGGIICCPLEPPAEPPAEPPLELCWATPAATLSDRAATATVLSKP